MAAMYRVEYRISNRHKWRCLGVQSNVPMPLTQKLRESIAMRQAPKYVAWHDVQLRTIIDEV